MSLLASTATSRWAQPVNFPVYMDTRTHRSHRFACVIHAMVAPPVTSSAHTLAVAITEHASVNLATRGTSVNILTAQVHIRLSICLHNEMYTSNSQPFQVFLHIPVHFSSLSNFFLLISASICRFIYAKGVHFIRHSVSLPNGLVYFARHLNKIG